MSLEGIGLENQNKLFWNQKPQVWAMNQTLQYGDL